MKNDKFTFVNDVESDIVGPEEMITKKQEESSEPPHSYISEDERFERIQIVRLAIIILMIATGIFVFGLVWQDSTSLLAICNAVWLVAIMAFFTGWMMLMNNMNILSPLTYGAKTFAKMITGKRVDGDYYTYAKMKEENQIPKYYYRICFGVALVSAIPAIILMLIV